MKKVSMGLLVIAGLIILVVFLSLFTVDETEQVLITRFGKIVREPVTDPGLHIKMPLVDEVRVFPTTLQEWDGDPGQFPTQDKTYIWVDSFARWRIVDLVAFYETITDVSSAGARLNEIIESSVRNYISEYPLIEAVRKSNRALDTSLTYEGEQEAEQQQKDFTIKFGRRDMTEGIKKQTQPKLDKFGIELADVKLKRINYTREVRESVYNRMKEERNQKAEKYISEGRGEASKIRGDKERELKQISSEAYKKAQKIKGEADAKALRIYADAYQRDPEFYSFVKTLDTYEKSLDKNNAVVLSTDSELFKYFKKY